MRKRFQLEELHQVLLDVETIINASRITSSQWPRATIEQSDMKETFARLLYGVQWHASVLLSILVDNPQESPITFGPALCDGQLSAGDEFSLLTAMKDDEESLKDRLKSVKLEDPTEKRLANELLKLKNRSKEEDYSNTSYRLPENRGALKDSESSLVADDSTGFSLVTSSSDLLYLNPLDLDLTGTLLGRGASAEVKKMNRMGGKYAIKIFKTPNTKEFDQEMTALQRLGDRPHTPPSIWRRRSNKEKVTRRSTPGSEKLMSTVLPSSALRFWLGKILTMMIYPSN